MWNMKLRCQKGTTLVELLAATAVMILFSLMMNTGFHLALKACHTMMSEAEAQLLLSTAADTVAGELRMARDVETDGDGRVLQYLSCNFGPYTQIRVNEEQQLAVNVVGNDLPLLPSGVYGTGGIYRIALEDGSGNPGIRYDKDTSVFTFVMKVRDAREDLFRAEAEFQVRCLNEGDGSGFD